MNKKRKFIVSEYYDRYGEGYVCKTVIETTTAKKAIKIVTDRIMRDANNRISNLDVISEDDLKREVKEKANKLLSFVKKEL